MANFCRQCGEHVAPEAVFCGNCGARVGAVADQTEQLPSIGTDLSGFAKMATGEALGEQVMNQAAHAAGKASAKRIKPAPIIAIALTVALVPGSAFAWSQVQEHFDLQGDAKAAAATSKDAKDDKAEKGKKAAEADEAEKAEEDTDTETSGATGKAGKDSAARTESASTASKASQSGQANQRYIGLWAGEVESVSNFYSNYKRCYGAEAARLSVNVKSIAANGHAIADLSVTYHGHEGIRANGDIASSPGDSFVAFENVTGTFKDGTMKFIGEVDGVENYVEVTMEREKEGSGYCNATVKSYFDDRYYQTDTYRISKSA